MVTHDSSTRKRPLARRMLTVMTFALAAGAAQGAPGLDAWAQQQLAVTAAPAAGVATISREAIQRAVRDTLAAEKTARAAQPAATDALSQSRNILGTDKYQAFSAAFGEAKIPDCFHQDALKHQPAQLGPIQFKEAFAIPFLLAAIVNGACR